MKNASIVLDNFYSTAGFGGGAATTGNMLYRLKYANFVGDYLFELFVFETP